jgi:hypothetical protein
MSTEITVVNDIVEINVQEDVIVIEAPSGAYPLPTGVYSVYGRTGNVVAQDGDYNLTQLGDVTITSPATGQVLRYNGTTWVNSTESYVGTVTSVAMTTPTGLTVTGSPITTAGTLALGLASGYSIPTTANQSLWTTAYNDKINSAAVTGLATKTLTLTQQDGGTITASWDDAEATRLVTEVYNSTGATLSKGTVVYINGGQGNLPTVTKAIATGDATSAQTYGVVQFDITNMNNGYVVVFGSLNNLDTQAYPVGTQLYLSGTTAGAWTSTKPYAPIHLVYVGIVVRSHPTQGVVEIKIQNGYELDELHDVSAQNPTNGDILQYVAATDLWTKTAGTTTNIAEGTNLYYTDARSRAAFSESVTGLDYNSTTGVLSTTTGYGIPTTASQATWNTAYNDSIVSAGVTGTTTKTLTLNQQDGGTITASWTDDNTDAVTSVFGRIGAVTAQSGDYTTTQVTEGTNLYFTNTRARAAISETVTGLDYDNTTGVLSTSAGYGIPTTASQTNWDTAYTNRITSASAPLSIASNAISISQANTTTDGYLSSTDWNTFNNKQAAGNYITALTGEATASGPGSASVTLTNSAVIGKVLTGLNVTGGSVSATDSILDAFGKVQNQINGLIGGSIYQGVWNASTNTPTLTSSVGTKGYYYIVNVAGSTNLNGITDWKVGDWAIYDGTAWQKVDNTDAVSSVNGFTGAVSLTTDNISEGSTNLYFTNTRAQNAITLTTTGTSGAATYSGGTLNIPQYQAVLTNPVTGTGTTNTLPKFTGTSAIGNSNITDDGSLITLGSNSYINGALGIGTSTLTGRNLVIEKNLTGSTIGVSVFNNSIIQSDVSNTATYYRSDSSTQAATFTINTLRHYFATQGTFGAGSTVSVQTAFDASSALVGATTNYGFRGQIPSGTNRWNIYMDGTANNYLAGSLGIGTTSLTQYNLRVSRNVTGSTSGYGIVSDGIIQSDVTTALMNAVFINTAASAFTINNAYAYYVSQSTIGANSAITSQHGYYAHSTLIGATNNYGFRGAIPSGTGRFNLYMDGTADNFLSGNTGIGVSGNLVSSGPILTTTLTNGGSGYVDGTYTDLASSIISGSAFADFALFTIVVSGGIVTTATLTWAGINYKAGDTLTISNTLLGGTGSGLIITVVTVDSSQLTIANANGGDITLLRNDSSLAAGENIGTIKWGGRDSSLKSSGLYAEIGAFAAGTLGGAYLSFFTRSITAGTSLVEAMRIDSRGGVGIGGSYGLAGYGLRVQKDITGATTAYGIASDGTIQSDVTAAAYYNRTLGSTQAATFTLGTLGHYMASQGTFGVGSTVTNQYGFIVLSTLTGATNNYAFTGQLAAASNVWNLYMSGNANNYLAGSLGIGSTALTGYNLRIAKSITGGTSVFSVRQEGTVQADVTSDAIGFRNDLNTTGSAFTLTNYFHYYAIQNTIGAGSAVTNQYGYAVTSNMTGATNNYGFHGGIPSGTNRWNLYMAGTAANYMAGDTSIGTTTGGYKLNVNGTTNINGRLTGADAFFSSTVANGNTIAWFDNNNTTTDQSFGLLVDAGTSVNDYALRVRNAAASELFRVSGNGGVGVNTGASINASARLQVDSTTQGFLPPRMTAAQRAAIASPATGLMVYQTDGTEGVYVYSGGTWKSLTMV